MKKVLLSLLLAVLCLPFAMAQTKANRQIVTLDTVVCDQFTWVNNVTYTADTSIMITRNDTMFVLNLTVDHNYNALPTVNVERGCEYLWNGHMLTTDTTITDSLKTVKGGCDSIATIALTLNHHYTHDSVVSSPFSFTWRDSVYTASTRDTVFVDDTTNTCDSTFTLDLTITKYEAELNVKSCGSYKWQIVRPRDTMWIDMGSYTVRKINYDTLIDTIFTESTTLTFDDVRLDTVYKLNLTLSDVYDTIKTSTCGAYTWHGLSFSATGIYDASVTNAQTLCDSNLHLDLTIKAQIDTTEVTRCGSYLWGIDSVRYTRDTIVSLNILDTVGVCDTVIKVLNLKVTHFTDTTRAEACGSYKWRIPKLHYFDTVITKASADANGIYNYSKYTGDTTTLCDSVFVLELKFNNIYDTIQKEACSLYKWRDTTFTESVSNNFTFTNEDTQCDSIYTLDITIFTKRDTNEVAACGSYFYKDSSYTESTTIVSNEVDINGCKTIHNIVLTLVENLVDTTRVEACGSYKWHDSTFFATTTFTDTVFHTDTIINCDSIVTLALTIKNKEVKDSIAGCGMVEWDSVKYYANTTLNYTTIDTTNQCQTDHTLILKITENSDLVTSTNCKQYVYTFTGNFDTITDTIFQSEYRRVTTTDSVTRCVTHHDMNVTIIPVRTGSVDRVASSCDSYRFKLGETTINFDYDVDTIITASKRGTTASTCYDSTAHLTLSIHGKTYTYPNNPTENVCDRYVWYYSTKQVTEGGNTTTVIDSSKTRIYTRSTRDTIKLGTDANSCDSMAVLNLTVYRTPVVTIMGNLDLNVGDTAYLYYECDQPAATHMWSYNGQTSTATSITVPNVRNNFDVSLVSTGDGGCVKTNYITVMANEGLGIDGVETTMVNLYPNPTAAYLTVSSEEAVSEVVIFNALGQQVSSRANLGTSATLDLSRFAAGTYSMRITLANGETSVRKFIVTK